MTVALAHGFCSGRASGENEAVQDQQRALETAGHHVAVRRGGAPAIGVADRAVEEYHGRWGCRRTAGRVRRCGQSLLRRCHDIFLPCSAGHGRWSLRCTACRPCPAATRVNRRALLC